MLNITPDGELYLTKHGRILSKFDTSLIGNIDIAALVQWENTARRQDFENSDNSFTTRRVNAMIQAEKEHERRYPLYSPEETIRHIREKQEEEIERVVDS